MNIVYTPRQAADADLALLGEHTVVRGTMQEFAGELDADVCAIRGADLAFSREMLEDFLDHARDAENYVYADLTYAGRPEMTLEFFPEHLIRRLREHADAFLPSGHLDTKYADGMSVHAFSDELLAGFVAAHPEGFRHPAGIQLEPAAVCNLKCEMCTWQVTYAATRRGANVMPFEQFEKLAAELETWPTKPGIEFCWRGEPLMNRRLPEAMAIFSDIGCNTCLITNATLLDEEMLDRIAAAKISSLYVSLDSLDKAEYEKVRKGASFDTVTANLERAIERLRRGPDPVLVGVRMVRMEENKRYWDAIFEQFENRLDIVSLQTEIYVEDDVYRGRNMFAFRPREFCILPFRTVAITSNGDVYSCATTNTDAEDEILGNIAEASLLDIWNGPKLAALREQMLALNVEKPYQCSRCSRMVCAAGFVGQTRRGDLLDKTLEGVRYTSRIGPTAAPEPDEDEDEDPLKDFKPRNLHQRLWLHWIKLPRAVRLPIKLVLKPLVWAVQKPVGLVTNAIRRSRERQDPLLRDFQPANLRQWIWLRWAKLPSVVRLPIKCVMKPPVWAADKTVRGAISGLGFNGADVRLTLRLFRSGIRDRYMGSMLGLTWAILNPLLLLGMYTFIFAFVFKARIMNNPSKFAYAVWMISGFVPYLAVADALSATAGAVINAGGLVKNVVFKSEILPIAATLGSALPCLVGLVLLTGLMCADGRYPTWHMVMLIPVMILQFTFMAGLGMFLAATTVFVRDIMQALTTIVLLIVFFTPIFYPLEKLPVPMQKVTFLNPFHHMVDAYRQIMWEQAMPHWQGMAYLGILGVVLFVVGLKYFRRLKGHFEMAL